MCAASIIMCRMCRGNLNVFPHNGHISQTHVMKVNKQEYTYTCITYNIATLSSSSSLLAVESIDRYNKKEAMKSTVSQATLLSMKNTCVYTFFHLGVPVYACAE